MARTVTGAGEEAGIYCRLSLAVMGDTTKVDDQERICRELATARGWRVPPRFVWKDNGRSAWQRDRTRPGWDAMLEAVRAGGLRNLIVYHGDRMVRQPYDLEVLINLADSRGVTITSPTGTRRLDVPEDRFVLGILANVARLESDNTSRRKKAGFERMRLAGRAPVPGGQAGRGFGYEADGRTPVPAEAAALQLAAGRLVAGEPITAICRDLTEAGITSTSGKALTYATLKRILLRPRIAGLLAGGAPGSWEPLLDRETWEMTCGVLRSGAPRAAGTPKYLLSGIATCGPCGGGLQRQSSARTLGYGCVAPGCRKVHRNMLLLDEYVIARVLARLASPQVDEQRGQLADPLAGQIAQLEQRRAQAVATAERLADEPGADLELLARAVASFTTRIGELRASAAGHAGARLLDDHAGLTRGQWDGLSLATRRALVSAAFTITVLPVTHRGPGFNPEDVRLAPR